MSASDILHVFICVNKKEEGKCCAGFDSEKAFLHLKDTLLEKKDQLNEKRRIKVVKTSCLGRCSKGPNIFIAESNSWYTFSSLEDLDQLIDSLFIKDEPVTRLLND